ncbi:hypothetical protein IXEL_29 [Microbacterium phage Ixel]|nr:hypothetical protein IXEL_29 [Microbacterium phage Ixel]
MHIILGYTVKGEVYVIGYTGSRKRAERFVEDYDDVNGEYYRVEIQTSHNI